MTPKKRILFVCLGNIIRSPLAENMFRYLAEKSGVGQKYDVDSAGTGAWHIGERPDARMRETAARHGFRYDGRARQFRRADFDEFDMIIVMDQNNQSALNRLSRSDSDRAKVHMMRAYDPEGQAVDAVPDPYYGGPEGFEITYSIVERSCQGLLDALENEAP